MVIKKGVGTGLILTSVLIFASVGCKFIPQTEAQEEQKAPKKPEIPAVDVAIARQDNLKDTVEYIGTTQPVREIALRSQVEGQLLSLAVDVGDRVTKGQMLAQLDDGLLQAAVGQAQAEAAAQQSEVIRAEGEVNTAQAEVESAKVALEQAKLDADRLQQLYEQGAIAKREVELARTEYRTAQQTLISAQSQVKVRQSGVQVAKGRVIAQESLIKQQQERLSYTRLVSPMTGYVLQRVIETGNLIQPGSEILRLGDFSQVKVVVPVSELDLAKIKVGQSVKVRLDAFPRDSFVGRVTNISPAADARARQVPIEVILPNPSQKIGSGLLARVNFGQGVSQAVVIPETALKASKEKPVGGRGTIFVVIGDKEKGTVRARMVRLGENRDGNVEVLAGLRPGERFVSRSNRPLQDNDLVRLSVLSE
ncbi:efflux RND transporter periplasmic adaptor subunit [Crocosphaera sp. XPORK-15E]|uniref:efflux RND transporter periplasmic adaptor subunit n=1 Tax=Crocosphaera sp. XPORK-15E TaxID=3110247 RepID=UPI002B1F43C1|nr:efflux RND transporter periplasmic adaptor subunit [Crocosphaera sp. XPORK-15E]MEA5535350.1 efflux RND transporter periplasmic adaptor subunit [Crocosphaera sp. XPORK-15E]